MSILQSAPLKKRREKPREKLGFSFFFIYVGWSSWGVKSLKYLICFWFKHLFLYTLVVDYV